jgi:hypothetical protein
MKRQFDSLEDSVRAGFTIILGDGWYAEGGETISRADYPALFEALRHVGALGGTSGDVSTTFNLPDLRDR